MNIYSNLYTETLEEGRHMDGSAQGEHIFNALGTFGLEMENLLNGKLSLIKKEDVKNEATVAIGNLKELASKLVKARDHEDFRSATKGDPANSYRYSQFVEKTRTALENIAGGNPSLLTMGYIQLNKLLDDLEFYTIDKVAHNTAQKEFKKKRLEEFNNWYSDTETLMYQTYKAIRDAALAVAKGL